MRRNLDTSHFGSVAGNVVLLSGSVNDRSTAAHSLYCRISHISSRSEGVFAALCVPISTCVLVPPSGIQSTQVHKCFKMGSLTEVEVISPEIDMPKQAQISIRSLFSAFLLTCRHLCCVIESVTVAKCRVFS